MDLKKHADTIVVLGGILTSVLWMNGKFNEVDKKFSEMEKHLGSIENRLTKVETVLIMEKIMPVELAAGDKK